MNNLDKQYQDLLLDILSDGTEKKDRTGTGTLSVFGRQIRHKMSEGFPLLTTKKMYWKGIVTELLWFLRGDTNIKYLVDNDCHIWDGDAYKNYRNKQKKAKVGDWDSYIDCYCGHTDTCSCGPMSKDEFINKIKTDRTFSDKWGDLGPIYGKQWRSFGDSSDYSDGSAYVYYPPIDQIAKAIETLKKDPDSRRIMVTSWNPSDLPDSVLPPCHYGFQFYTRELSLEERCKLWCDRAGKNLSFSEDFNHLHLDSLRFPKRALSIMYNARSQDVPLGTPFNIASYALLLSIISEIVNMVPYEVITNMGDCHIYLDQIDGVNEQISRNPRNLPRLIINKEPFNNYSFASHERPTNLDQLINDLEVSHFVIDGYDPHPQIKMPLSN